MKNRLSIIGSGMVGTAIYHGFSPCFDIKIYDKFKIGYNSLEETLNHSEYIFICVPTPMNNIGEQDLSNIYRVILEINKHTEDRKILIIKSTVLPGTTTKLQEEFENFDFVFNPEFLTARTNILDFINQSRIILGGCKNEVLNEVEKLYRIRFSHTPIYKTGFEEAEFVKYMSNCFFASKVSIMNEFYQMCKFLKIDYEEVKKMFLSDGRIGNSHVEVPGPDGEHGYGGACFPKDINALIKWCEKNNLGCSMFKATNEVNNRVREKKDWLEIKGATSENNYN